jgi:hypothetical protein
MPQSHTITTAFGATVCALTDASARRSNEVRPGTVAIKTLIPGISSLYRGNRH